jgi:hypothetical protein
MDNHPFRSGRSAYGLFFPPTSNEFARAELGEQVAIYLRPQRWLSADLEPG